MNHPWQQPIRPLEVLISDDDTCTWSPVLFIRPRTTRGWEVTTLAGFVWSDLDCLLRPARLDD